MWRADALITARLYVTSEIAAAAPSIEQWDSTGSRVVIQQATESRTPTDRTLTSPRHPPIDESIVESLVIPLPMIVIDEFGEGASEVGLAQGHYPIEALVLDRPHEPLGIRVRIRRSKRGPHNVHGRIAQQLSYVLAPLGVPITNEHAMGTQQAVRLGERAPHLSHEQPVGMRCGPHDLDAA